MSVNIERLKELWDKRNDSQYAYLILKEELSIVMPAIIRELEAGRKLEKTNDHEHLGLDYKGGCVKCEALAEYREARGDDG